MLNNSEVISALLSLKNKKAPGIDDISNELLKYGGNQLTSELTKMIKIIFQQTRIPQEWKTSVTIPVYKRGNRNDPSNYRGITLLCTNLKLLTKILLNKLKPLIKTNEEQYGFRRNRSTVDALFVVRQVIEKSIEYSKPAFMCFVDLSRAFDRVRLEDVLTIIRTMNIPSDLIALIKHINLGTETKMMTENGLSEPIRTLSGVRQGDSLSPALFSLIMDELISHVKEMKGYNLGEKDINIVCYADDAVLITESEDDLQRLLHQFGKIADKFNMQVSVEKTKSLVVSKEPIRCKLEFKKRMVEQVMAFKYLGCHLTSDRNLYNEVKDQAIRGARMSGCLKDIVWRNKFMSTEAKVKIYKAAVRPIISYAVETRADTTRTEQLLRSTEMKTLRSILGLTLWDKIRSKDIREECEIQDIVKWTKDRRRYWNEHVDRANAEGLIKIARDGRPAAKRPRGRPPKRWKESWASSSTET